MRIAIDFDGVIHDPTNVAPGYRMGVPITGAREAILGLLLDGHECWVFTVRGDAPQHVRDWLEYFKFPPLRVTNEKWAADVYLDDRAVRFTTWTDALLAIA